MRNKEDHDPFCPCAQTEQECDLISFDSDECISCECNRIALVRIDEQERILGEVNHQLDWLGRLTNNSIFQIRNLININVRGES
jgi:hypothetical protein